MLCTLIEKPFDGQEWFFEVKWDGYRIIAVMEKDKIKLYSRTAQDYTDRYAPAVQDLKKLKHSAVLDGEMVVVDEKGLSSFQGLQNYMKTGQGTLRYYVFDIMSLDGQDLKNKSLADRKAILKKLLAGRRTYVHYSGHVQAKGVGFFKEARRHGMEGIVAKDSRSVYHPGGRGREWLKIKIHREQEAVIGGFTQPRGGREFFGALVLGVYNKGKLEYIGHTGGGFDQSSLKTMIGKLKPLAQKESPFEITPKTNTPVTWVKPKLVCQVKFQEWTGDGIMRQPIFLGLREDKKALEVKRELPKK